ncbi:Hypothetical predicted protein [Lynx pardinus]|uniref:Cyclin-like domain-containing protein n=1 Tax=Lynx pardinus TaxID=191816 RepID=A0A485MZ50_LYNPA|nr:Hypothetical predicted protein [Lynx pardinus]
MAGPRPSSRRSPWPPAGGSPRNLRPQGEDQSRLSAPSPRGPRAACPALGAAPGPQLPRPPLQASTPRVPCEWGRPLDERRLAAHPQLALGREARPWRGGQPQIAGPAVEMCHKVQEIVLSLLGLKNIFNFSQITFNLALTTFSHLLVSVKIRERLLHCVMITCLRLAATFNEEEELIPRIKDFIKHYGSGCTPGELLRVELAILDRLHWDLYIGIPLDFLTIVNMRSLQSLP